MFEIETTVSKTMSLENKIPPPIIMLISVILVVVIAQLDASRHLIFTQRLWVAILITVVGFACMITGVLHFRSAKTTINPLIPDAASRLVVHGVYQYTRNPMYLGMALLICGALVYFGSLWAWLILPLFVLFIHRFQILPEERALAIKFNDEFVRYCQRTRRWL